MIYIKNDSNNPYFNLALEEYFLKAFKGEEYFILWQNEPAIIIGRNQNTIEEINKDYVEENNIKVVRRLSGGGAVYHDLGNLNFTFIVKANKANINNFKKFTDSIVDSLEKIGVKAEFTGRNDITIEGKKFSGNSQYYFKDRLLHHGTILFNSDLSVVQNALQVKASKIESKGIKSVRSRVTNVYPYLTEKVSVKEFKEILLHSIFEYKDVPYKEYVLEQNDIDKIQSIADEKYATWDWTYGESPEFNMEKSKRYPFGQLNIKLDIKDGKIKVMGIYGDFFANKDLSRLEEGLLGVNFKEESVREAIQGVELQEYIQGITNEDFIDCMFY
ncbi:lipoate--protein ligase [Clostridium estertheticum]|uniref:lipoate--protein ligase n=1 Tax=Clostridium estertheticum TaxID=238834 RepID=UPI0013E97A23|nr:lipoate--protein ligase [Clostridium estertheticum]MBZ9686970.1 lipoate--protein ligase [Clostridium estertheticum]